MASYQCLFLDQFGRILRKVAVETPSDLEAMEAAVRCVARLSHCRSIKIMAGTTVMGVYERTGDAARALARAPDWSRPARA